MLPVTLRSPWISEMRGIPSRFSWLLTVTELVAGWAVVQSRSAAARAHMFVIGSHVHPLAHGQVVLPSIGFCPTQAAATTRRERKRTLVMARERTRPRPTTNHSDQKRPANP